MAMVQNRGNGSWRVTISGGYGPDGKQIRLTRTIKVDPNKTIKAQEQIAKREAAALETDYQRHLITEAKKTRLSEVAEEYLEHKQIAARTKAGYRMLLDTRILPALGKAYVQDLSARQIREFYHLPNDCCRSAADGYPGSRLPGHGRYCKGNGYP